MILYKYTSMNIGLNILKNGLIRFTQPISFDSPFEASPIIESVCTTEQMSALVDTVMLDESFIEEQMEQTLSKIYYDTDPIKRVGWTLDQCLSMGKKALRSYMLENNIHLPTYIKQLVLANFTSMQNNMAAKVIHKLKTEIGILCLSAVNNNEVLWASYADDSFGLVIGFDSNYPFFNGVLKVSYDDNRPRISFPEAMNNNEGAQKIALDLISTKPSSWSGQQEYRIVRPIVQADEIKGNDRVGYPICLFRFPLESIVEVIVGSRVIDLKEIHNVLNRNGLSKIRLGKIEPSKDQFDLLVVWN